MVKGISEHTKLRVGIQGAPGFFRGEFTRFENPEDKRLGSKRQDNGGEILGSKVNGDRPFDNSASPFGYDDQPTTVPF